VFEHLALLLWLTLSSIDQSSPPVLRGTWTATAGKQVFHGTWSAQAVPNSPDAANGSWALLNQSNQIVVMGTWSAVKTPRSWSGTWQARIVPAGGRGTPGKLMAGTWRADIESSDQRTLGELLQESLQREITGAWQSGPLSGRWSLKGSPR
jgi:hypothetical protein